METLFAKQESSKDCVTSQISNEDANSVKKKNGWFFKNVEYH